MEINMKIIAVHEYDVAVIGGGTAGAPCAIAAAEGGLKTVIVERMSCLGGSQVNSLVCPSMAHHIQGETDGPFPPMLKRVAKRLNADTPGTANGPRIAFDPLKMASIYEDMADAAGVDIMYESALAYANTENGRITSVVAATKKGLMEIKAKIFVDCTGDALLSEFAGATVFKGDEHGVNQRTSLRCEVSGIDFAAFGRYLKEGGQKYDCDAENIYCAIGTCPVFDDFLTKEAESGELTKQDVSYLQMFMIPGRKGALAFNCPEMGDYDDFLDPFEASRVYIEGRRSIRRLYAALKKHIPGFEDAYVSAVAPVLGIRESKRVDAVYTLTAEDVISKKMFDDAIVRCNYPIDVHGKTLNFNKVKTSETARYYEIPYRSLLSKDVENLMVAGRCAGFDFTAQSSVRIQMCCVAMGEACGRAAVMSVKGNVPVRDIDGAALKAAMITE